jgi:hypothetical protein
MMQRRRVVRPALAILAVLATVVVAGAQTATLPPPVGQEGKPSSPLAPSPSRVGVFAGAFYGSLSGSHIEHVDPGAGFDGGASYRVLSDLSVWASFATSSYNVSKQQVTQLLGKDVLDSGRSATVEGSLTFTRVRVGVRVDGLRESTFRFQPYFVGAAIFTTNKAKLDTVDGVPPANPSHSDSKIGGYGRFGVELHVTPRVDVDGFATYEVFEFPASTNAALSAGGGVHFRL